MEIGVLGHHGQLVVLPVKRPLKFDRACATIRPHPMEELHVLDQLVIARSATSSSVLEVGIFFISIFLPVAGEVAWQGKGGASWFL